MGSPHGRSSLDPDSRSGFNVVWRELHTSRRLLRGIARSMYPDCGRVEAEWSLNLNPRSALYPDPMSRVARPNIMSRLCVIWSYLDIYKAIFKANNIYLLLQAMNLYFGAQYLSSGNVSYPLKWCFFIFVYFMGIRCFVSMSRLFLTRSGTFRFSCLEAGLSDYKLWSFWPDENNRV